MKRDHDVIQYSLDFVEGEIKGMYISTALDSIYKQMFNNAKRSAKRKPTNVIHGVKLIVFGCFMIEAKANSILEQVLKLEIENNKFSTETWKILKRSNVLKKIELICSSGSVSHLEQFKDIKSSLENVFNLRNRLAHYKNEKEQIASAITHDDAMKLFATWPIPSVSKQLSWENTSQHVDTISYTNRLLSKINTWVKKKSGVQNKR